jgi:hypothetical protein
MTARDPRIIAKTPANNKKLPMCVSSPLDPCGDT